MWHTSMRNAFHLDRPTGTVKRFPVTRSRSPANTTSIAYGLRDTEHLTLGVTCSECRSRRSLRQSASIWAWHSLSAPAHALEEWATNTQIYLLVMLPPPQWFAFATLHV